MLKNIISKFVARGESADTGSQLSLYYKLFDRRVVDKVEESAEPGQRLELIAREIGVSTNTVLETVSNHLQLNRAAEVFLPNDDFLASFASVFETFRGFAVIPQPTLTTAAYRLIVADPALVSLEAFRSQGIEVLLGDYRSIIQVLNQWGERLYKPFVRVESFLRNVWETGGRELQIGVVEGGYHYSFQSEEGVMGGRISGALIGSLDDYICGESRQLKFSESVSIRVARSEDTGAREKGKLILQLSLAGAQMNCPNFNSSDDTTRRPDAITDRLTHSPKFKKDVLIVEDDLGFSQTLASILESKGYSVCCVFSVEEFEQCIAASDLQVRLVISDYRLGGRNGGDVIRACSRLSDPVPVIFLTEDNDPRAEAYMIQLGTQAFVRKSANPMILLAWVMRLLGGSGLEVTTISQSKLFQ